MTRVDASVPAHRESADLSSARRVLALEARALEAFAVELDESFVRCLDLLERMPGRVIVTGMGKSGHIARKIAATLASTGTPALFVHPAEASHGDLGMITSSDAILALSNSGETPELADLVTYAKRFEIPLIAITGHRTGSLGLAADAVLVLPGVEEACPLGLAPTTSTTATLAIGDCIAVALLERKGFSSADFRILHPGGKLARRLLRVSDVMHKGEGLPLIPSGAPMSEALIAMTAKGFGCVGVVDQAGLLVGVITDGDLRRHMSQDLIARNVDEVMTRTPKFIGPDALASEALLLMNQHGITNLFVLSEKRPVGIVHVHDCLRAGVA